MSLSAIFDLNRQSSNAAIILCFTDLFVFLLQSLRRENVNCAHDEYVICCV